MLKLTEAADLEKAGRSLGSYFAKQAEELQKSHAFHAAVSAHHGAMASAHKVYAASNKAAGDGLSNDHELKHHFSAAHTHHTEMSAHHEAVAKAFHAHAEATKAELDTIKTLAADWGSAAKADGTPAPTNGIPLDVAALAKGGSDLDTRIKAVSDAMMIKALEALDQDPMIAQRIQGIVLSQVEKAVGGKLVPSSISAVTPDNPRFRAVPRGGQQPVPEQPNVPLEFQKLVAIDEDTDRN